MYLVDLSVCRCIQWHVHMDVQRHSHALMYAHIYTHMHTNTWARMRPPPPSKHTHTHSRTYTQPQIHMCSLTHRLEAITEEDTCNQHFAGFVFFIVKQNVWLCGLCEVLLTQYVENCWWTTIPTVRGHGGDSDWTSTPERFIFNCIHIWFRFIWAYIDWQLVSMIGLRLSWLLDRLLLRHYLISPAHFSICTQFISVHSHNVLLLACACCFSVYLC